LFLAARVISMTFQANPAAIPFVIAAVVSALLAVFAWRRRSLSMASAFAMMMTGETIWAGAEALELLFIEFEAKRPFLEMRVAGAVIAILGLVAVVLRYTGRINWLRLSQFCGICTPAVVMILFAWTNARHHFYWIEHVEVELGGFAFLKPVYGPAFWVHFSYCYGLIAAVTILLAQAVATSKGLYRVQAAAMLFGVSLPWAVNIIDMTRLFGIMYTDTTAMTFAITSLAFVPAIFRYRLLELTPVAWESVVRGMNDPVVVIDRFGRIVELNEVAQKLSGLPLDEIVGYEASEVFSRWPKLAERLTPLPEHGERSFELTGGEAGASSAFDARISRLGTDEAMLGWVLVLRDITAHKDAALERERMFSEQAARAEAEAASRAKDRFMATLSHELRTPLTPVLASVTAMLGDAETPESMRTVLEMIRRNVSLEASLIDDLLDLARIRRESLHLKREIVDAHELINQVTAICADDASRAELEVSLDLGADFHHLDADPIRFQQVLWNLVKNAIKFTPSGGHLTVRTMNKRSGSADRLEDALLVEISDTGIGIEADGLHRVFDVAELGGSSATRRFGGLGLGLTLSRSIVEQHGGEISARSEGAGKGATFTIIMPTVPEPKAPAEPNTVPGSDIAAPVEPDHRQLRILLVDDNADTLKFLSVMLRRRGHHVATAGDMATALRLSSESEPDVIVSDIELPDGDGRELMDTIRSTRPIPGIALSGFGSAEDVEQSLAAGFTVHLTKPVDFRRLERAIQQVAAGAAAEDLVGG
jgi:PAS domain S-box-containing protein